MATLQYRRCAWMLNIINVHAPITREKINEYYRDDEDVNPYHEREIPVRTFQKTLRAIEDIFGVLIHCNRAFNEYSIEGGKVAGLSRTRKVSTIDIATREMRKWTELDAPVQLFRIDAMAETAERLRENPICEEQREVSADEETGITIFEYLMKPTWEWYEAIRSLGAAVKVIYPKWLADLVADDAQGVANMYKEDKDNRLACPGFINPYNCRIVDIQKASLYLTIPQPFYAALLKGELEEYNVAIRPDNAWHLVQMDAEKREPMMDEEGNLIPVQYETIHFKVNDDMDSPEAIVEVTKAESFELTDVREEDRTEDNPMEHVVTYTLGKVLQTWSEE